MKIKVSPSEEENVYKSYVTDERATLILNKGIVAEQYKKITAALPSVTMYYAIKSMPDKEVINTLYECGCNFDVATSGEIDILKELSVESEKTIHTHPIKTQFEIEKAIEYGCEVFVVDNLHELLKFIPYKDKVSVLVRVSFRSANAKIDLSKKFGCNADKIEEMLSNARSLGIKVIGLSFHVGSQNTDPSMYVTAISKCATVFENYTNLKVLDIGGGFPIAYDGDDINIVEFCAPINTALELIRKDVKVIAEPGRFISGPSVKAVTTIVGKAIRDDRVWYYLNDGVYGSYSGTIFDHVAYPIQVFSDSDELQKCVLAGPTCDSVDVIAEDIMLPDLEIGDIIVGHQMGSYTHATTTEFNCIKKPRIIYVL